MNSVLFVCSQNKMRSPTAEHVARLKGLSADSAGTDPNAVRHLTAEMVDNAENVVCFEWSHYEKVVELRPSRAKDVLMWNMPDEYDYCDPLLVRMLERLIENVLC